MMVMVGGRERTRDEFSSIFAAAGFRLASITPTATPLCVIEGILNHEDTAVRQEQTATPQQ